MKESTIIHKQLAFNSIPKDKNPRKKSKLKAFTDNRVYVTKNLKFVF